MADAAAEDFAEDVAAAFVRGLDAVGDEEGGGAGVVGDDAQGRSAFFVAVAGLLGCERGSGKLGCLSEERREEVGLVVGEDSLEDAGYAFEAHAGVDGGLGERGKGAVGCAIELHEDEVPDLHVSLVVFTEGDVGAGL